MRMADDDCHFGAAGFVLRGPGVAVAGRTRKDLEVVVRVVRQPAAAAGQTGRATGNAINHRR